MAISSYRGKVNRNTEAHVSRKWKQQKDRDATPERNAVWSEPSNKLRTINGGSERKVSIVYYLSRNGQLEHPHFMEVPLSSNDGLYLRDVINRLNVLRGKGMASLYSWSAKRSYRNGFVWHDLADNDFVYPAHGNEYVLKGSKLLDASINPNQSLFQSTLCSTSPKLPDVKKHSPGHYSEFPAITRRRNQCWSSIELNEYKVYKAKQFSESARMPAADASTQTDDKRRRQQLTKKEEIVQEQEEKGHVPDVTREEEIEISPPQSDSSPETIKRQLKADGRLILNHDEESSNRMAESCGRMKASTVLMQLISCVSISFRDCGATAVKEHSGLSLIGHYRGRLPRGGRNTIGTGTEVQSSSGLRLEDKENFSGSLIDTKKDELPALRRSNSCKQDWTSQLHMDENEIAGTSTECHTKSDEVNSKQKGKHHQVPLIKMIALVNRDARVEKESK